MEEFTDKNGDERIRIVFVHHKNSTKGFHPILFDIPLGDLTDLLLFHIQRGSEKLMAGTSVVNLFMSHGYRAFTDQTLRRYFRGRVLKEAPFDAFAPVECRRIFVEGYCQEFGPDPEMWDGASTVSYV